MRKWILALGMIVTVSACGLIDDEESDDTTDATTAGSTSTTVAAASDTATAAKPTTRTKKQFIDACTETVPTMAYLGNKQAVVIWKQADQKDKALRQACTEIATNAPKKRAALEQAIDQTEKFLADKKAEKKQNKNKSDETKTTKKKKSDDQADDGEKNGAKKKTTTTTIPPKPSIAITCPAESTRKQQSFRATYDVETSGKADIEEWWIDYGEGKQYKARAESVAEEELYWHVYWAPGSYTVKAWVIDEYGRRSQDTCTVTWRP